MPLLTDLKIERSKIEHDIKNIESFINGEVRRGIFRDGDGSEIIHCMKDEDKPRAKRTVAQLKKRLEEINNEIINGWH